MIFDINCNDNICIRLIQCLEKPTSKFRMALANHNYILMTYNRLLREIKESETDEEKKNKTKRFNEWYNLEKDKRKEDRLRDFEFRSDNDLDKIMVFYQNKINNYFKRYAEDGGYAIYDITLDTKIEKVLGRYKPVLFGIKMKIRDNKASPHEIFIPIAYRCPNEECNKRDYIYIYNPEIHVSGDDKDDKNLRIVYYCGRCKKEIYSEIYETGLKDKSQRTENSEDFIELDLDIFH